MSACFANKRKIGAILPLAVLMLTLAPHAAVEASPSRCGAHTSIVDVLEKKYGETAHGIGLVSDKGVMQVYVSQEKGTWTILMTDAKGQSCLIAAGNGWEDVKPKAKGENA